MGVHVIRRRALSNKNGYRAPFCLTVFFTVFLTHYSLVSSRARQIALLPALRASRGFIARAVIGESAVPLSAGLGLGFALTAVARKLLQRRVNVDIPYSLDLYLVATIAGLGGSLPRMLQIVRKSSFYFRTGPPLKKLPARVTIVGKSRFHSSSGQ